MQWSPQQIAGWLQTRFPEDPSLQISHEAIYQTLFVQARGALKKELQRHLRSGRVMRHGRTATRKGQTRYQIVDAVSIRERPPEIEDRSVPGHWEGDLLCGSRNTHIATLVERQSRFTLLVRLSARDAQTVAKALSRQIRKLPAALRRSLTLDRGPEFAAHRRVSIASNQDILLRSQEPVATRNERKHEPPVTAILPKWHRPIAILSSGSEPHCARLNQRPRKTLQYSTPAGKLSELLR